MSVILESEKSDHQPTIYINLIYALLNNRWYSVKGCSHLLLKGTKRLLLQTIFIATGSKVFNQIIRIPYSWILKIYIYTRDESKGQNLSQFIFGQAQARVMSPWDRETTRQVNDDFDAKYKYFQFIFYKNHPYMYTPSQKLYIFLRVAMKKGLRYL